MSIYTDIFFCLFVCLFFQPNNESRFKITVTESGTTFNEEVVIGTEEKTETLHIPQHNNVDLSDIKHIFDLVCKSIRSSLIFQACAC